MSEGRDHADIDSYVADELTPNEIRAVEEHLDTCTECREEAAVLRELQQLLADMPPEVLLDGPPDDADLLLQRTLRQVRTESSAVEGRRRYLAAAAAAAVAAVALVGGVLVGRVTLGEQTDIAAAPPASTQPAAPVQPGTRYASALDPGTGARLTAAITPAAGWVRVNVAVTGIPAGQRCQLIVIGKDGSREMAGGWLVSEQGANGGTTLDGSALIAPDDVAGVAVQNTDGKQFVEAKV
jgi:hypothetical protein